MRPAPKSASLVTMVVLPQNRSRLWPSTIYVPLMLGKANSWSRGSILDLEYIFYSARC
jgi:hypothetical protein